MLLVRIAHCKQKEDESVQSYSNDMHLLFAQSEYPEALRRDALLSNLKPSLHKKVLLSIPRTAAEVVEHVVFTETQEVGARTVDRLKEWENSQTMAKADPVDRITKSLEKITLSWTNMMNRTEPRQPTSDRARLPNRNVGLNAANSQSYKCSQYRQGSRLSPRSTSRTSPD